MEDSYRHKGQRKKLVQLLNEKGIKDERALNAINNVPRHLFLDKAFESHAYENKAFQIGEGQTISHPYTVAFQTQTLDIKRGDKVLEIGTGSGYQACVLDECGARVFSIERFKTLHHKTTKFLKQLGYDRIKTFFGDGYQGLPTFSPFDKVIVTAAAPYIPDPLKEQLKINGILCIPVDNEDGSQTMHKITRVSETTFSTEIFEDFRFVPMLKGKNF